MSVVIIRLHCVHVVQKCGLLLLMWRGVRVCLSVSVCLLDTTVSPAETDEPVEMSFGLWTRVGPRNHVFGPDPSGVGAVLGVWDMARPIVK